MRDTAASPVILLAFANDRDAYLENLQRERASLFESLQSLDDRGAIQVHKQEETTIEGLFKTLNRYADRIAIIHYAGHANGTALQLETEAASGGGNEPAHAIGLARRFAQLPALQLVFLNGCATAGQVTVLLDAGVKAVIATSVRVDDALATAFAHQFYAALASEAANVSIAGAFTSASAFVGGRDPNRPVTIIRGAFKAAQPASRPDGTDLAWGLYPSYDAGAADAALAWSLPASAASPIDSSIALINSGKATIAEVNRLVAALGFERSAATPIPPETARRFTETVTALAMADHPAERRAAASIFRGEDASAYDQLIVLAEAGEPAQSAEAPAEVAADTAAAAAATRFRQAGAIAAPTSVTRALQAYHRAVELAPNDSWTRIELARLYRISGDVDASRTQAERAIAVATDDYARAAADNERGEAARATGDLDEAYGCFMRGLALAEKVVATAPADAEWRRDLSTSHSKVGEIAVLARNSPLAHHHFARSLALREQLVAEDPANPEWQRDLSISHNKLGEVAVATGNRVEAGVHFTASRAIGEALVRLDPANLIWQTDLSITHNKLGDLARENDDLEEAGRCFTAGFDIRARVAAQDPANTYRQRGLAISHGRLGQIAQALDDAEGARHHFNAGLAICQRLAAIDPANAEWQRDLSAAHERLGNLAAATGDRAAALRHFTDSLPIARALAARRADHRSYQEDLAYTRRRITELGGDPDAG